MSVYRLRSAISYAAVFLVCAAIGLVSAELTLRIYPEILGSDFATGVRTKYSTAPDGIYYTDPGLRMNFMKPNFTTTNYYKGHTWLHQTDSHGFRNPTTRNQAEILLLGDSFIYGHGVNIDETVGTFLEQDTHLSVMNLGAQGHCAFQEAYLLTEYLPKLKPRYVIYFFFDNDISDLYVYLSDEEINEFIEKDLTEINYRPRHNRDELIKTQNYSNQQMKIFNITITKPYLVRAVDMFKFKADSKEFEQKSFDEMHNIHNAESIGWKYTKKAILYMDSLARSHGSSFIVVPITMNERVHEILGNFAMKQKLRFIEEPRIYMWDRALFLPRDGHFNKAGASKMATIVAEYLMNIEFSLTVVPRELH